MEEKPLREKPSRSGSAEKLLAEAFVIEAEDARKAGALGYMANSLVQATIPHSRREGVAFERSNGLFSLAITAHPRVGLPYGTIPRLLLSWLTTEAVRTKDPILLLGPTLSGFMADLDLIPTGGRWGSITRLRHQMKRLFSSSISCLYENDELDREIGFRITKEYTLWWDPKEPDKAALWKSTVTLSRDFFDEIVDRPVPIDMRALKALKRSALALDIYCWLTYRMSYLKKPTEIPWGFLRLQFGADYSDTKQGRYDFKREFARQLKRVLVVYPQARVGEGDRGLVLHPSPPHVPALSPKL